MQAVIIAAGESSRFWPLNKEHKSQLYLLGKPIIYWTIKGLLENGIKDIIIVCSKDSTIPPMLEKENDLGAKLTFVVQEERLGTGNAVWQAREFINEPFLVVWPNKVNAGEIVKKILEEKNRKNAEVILVGAETQTPWDYGVARMAADGARVAEIVENPERGKEPSNIKIIGLYALEPDFFSYYEKIPRHHESDFIDGINLYLKEKKGSLVTLEQDVPALKYPWELFGILDILFGKAESQQIIAPSAKIGEGTVIEGPAYIGEDCDIGSHNVLRGPLHLERGVKTGAFCEIKHSIVQEGTHFHSGYVGDSIIGENCRFGAGFIAANTRLDRNTIHSVVKEKKIDTGLTHFGTIVGDNTRFGIHSGTMPGVLIGKDCIVYPGVHVFENMPDCSVLKASA